MHARLVVAADGVRSPVRDALGIRTREHDYRQSSLVALVRTSEPHRNTAWQRFLPGGPLAFLPLEANWCSIVWTRPTAEAERLLTLDVITSYSIHYTKLYEDRYVVVANSARSRSPLDMSSMRLMWSSMSRK